MARRELENRMQSKHGGRRAGAGRPTGSTNRATTSQKATLGELARAHASEAIAALAEVATRGESESARVSAACALLDRAFGRPVAAIPPEVERPKSDLATLLEQINARGGSKPPIVSNPPPISWEYDES